MKRSGLAKNSGCLAFLNPGGRLADLISEILEAQEGSLHVSGSIDALSLLCALASSASFSQLLPSEDLANTGPSFSKYLKTP